ncbi:LuxR C-terminal-related transcriptional regulator [Micromonospora sp. HM5-17]|uniref:LuxR C-terminal-related transcriptional regulator n=1 Tax=Micromonospora sp. HM5-17 TaxID=2487710 RepID=UPI000F4625F8|nr:LuxR C-terminal-related transcriptional regulator [Micromonospora sp. HM5-17]ROT26258.1 DNA-binding response regulator [Micromonospora sp. HM5-17]
MLSDLGIDPADEILYRLLLREPRTQVAELAARLAEPESQIGQRLERMVTLGLLRRSLQDQNRFVPVSPGRALGPLLARARAELLAHQQRVERGRAAVDALAAEFPGLGSWEADNVQLHEGPDAAWACLEHIAVTARISVQVLGASGAPPGLADDTDYRPAEELAVQVARRGAAVRLVLLDSITFRKPLLDGARQMWDHGVQIRTVPALPVWLFVVDDDYVVIALDPADNRAGVLQVRSAGAVAAARDLFDRYWRVATPLVDAGTAGDRGELTPMQRQLLALLADGATDAAAAKKLSCSERTVGRMVAALQNQAGVKSRLQLGVRAVQLGWLDPDE